MDKKAIKNFAINARKTLSTGVSTKLSKLGITEDGIEEAVKIDNDLIEIQSTGARFSGKEISSRAKLVTELQKRENQGQKYELALETLIEEVAYTWFNRIIAIRFMEVNDYLPGRQRVLSSETPGKKEPDVITNLLDTDLYEDLDQQSKERVTALLTDGSAVAVDELYQLVFIKQCNSLNAQLPDLFERIDDYTELLITISYIDEIGVIASLLTIPESDFDVSQEGQIEIIGWMYQYYNTEPKDKVFARGSRKIRADEIPAATQLFTPDWIVRYMVENSLGRYYIDQKLANPLEERTEKEIADSFGWKYYLPTAEQPEDVQLQIQDERKEKSVFALQELKLIDPSMGSGHILVYAFDVFIQLYKAEGETPRIAAELILKKNLFGLDIDKRAFQLSYFALMMKGRQYSRRILNKDINPNVYVIPTQSGISEAELQLLNLDFPNPKKAQEDLLALSEGFLHGSDLGSLIEFKGIDFENLRAGLQAENNVSFLDQAVSEIIQVGELLQQKYHIGITNPPYMGSSGMNKTLSDYVKKSYPDSKSDMFGIFIERLQKMTDYSGYYAMITQHAWMFLSSFEKLRKKLNQQTIINMIHLGTRAFEEIGGEVVQTTAFVMSPAQRKGFSGKYLRLVDFANHELKEEKTLEALASDSVDYLYNAVQDNFAKIPGSPISYWVSENLIQVFKNPTIGDSYEATTGLQTSDNNRFVRYWWEPQNCKISFCSKDNSDSVNSKQRWFPYNKGGGYRKWYGNNWHVLNWKNDGEDVREYNDYLNSSRASNIGIGSVNFFFRENISWSKITSSKFSSTWQPSGYIFDVAASSMFGENLTLPLSLLNSIVAEEILKIFNPTLNFQVGNINKIPLIINSTVAKITVNNIELSKSDWDSSQVSWDFKKHPLI